MIDLLPATMEAERRLRELYGERMLGYGFYVPDCDCDDCEDADAELLVVLADGFDRDAELWRMSEIASEAGAPEGVFLLIRPLSREQYERPNNDFLGQRILDAAFAL